MGKGLRQVLTIQVNDNWETPNFELYEAMKKYKIKPEIDVAASKCNAKFPIFYTKENNALSQKWDKPFFMNPPYSKVAEFMDYAIFQHQVYNVPALILVYSKTSTKWWHKYVEDKLEHHNLDHRIQFEINGIIPRWCKQCAKRHYKEISVCPNLRFKKELGRLEKCGNRLTKNSAMYDNVWIILRSQK